MDSIASILDEPSDVEISSDYGVHSIVFIAKVIYTPLASFRSRSIVLKTVKVDIGSDRVEHFNAIRNECIIRS